MATGPSTPSPPARWRELGSVVNEKASRLPVSVVPVQSAPLIELTLPSDAKCEPKSRPRTLTRVSVVGIVTVAVASADRDVCAASGTVNTAARNSRVKCRMGDPPNEVGQPERETVRPAADQTKGGRWFAAASCPPEPRRPRG